MAKKSFKIVYQNLSEIEKRIIMMRLKGVSYERINSFVERKNLDLKKTEIRKLIDDIIHADIGYYSEDKYEKIFDIFAWDMKSFSKVLDEPSFVFLYCDYKFENGVKRIPHYFGIASPAKKFKFKGIEFPFNINAFLYLTVYDHSLKSKRKGLKAETLKKKLQSIGYTGNKTNLRQTLKSNKNLIEINIDEYRYFDDSQFERSIKGFEKRVQRRKGLYSAEKLFKDDEIYYRNLGILSSVSLYDIINKYKTMFKSGRIIKNLRYPCILYGYDNKKEYFESIIKRYHRSTIEEVADIIHDEYGVERKYVILNLKNSYKDKIGKDGYINRNEIAFTAHQVEVLTKRLKDPYYSYGDFLNIIRKIKTGNLDRLLDSEEVLRLGYRKEYNYFVKNDITDIKSFLARQILRNEFFEYDRLDTMDSLKKGVVEGLVSSYKLIQISDEEYITSKKLRGIGLYKKDINRFLKQIEELVGKQEFFTIEQLFEMEKFELIDDFNFDERFYEEVIRVCNRFGSIQIDGSELYCVSKKKVNRFNFMEKYFNDVNDNIHIFDLVKKIENEYRIEVSQHTIKMAAEELGYYYDDTFEKIYRNKECFLREVFDNENRY